MIPLRSIELPTGFRTPDRSPSCSAVRTGVLRACASHEVSAALRGPGRAPYRLFGSPDSPTALAFTRPRGIPARVVPRSLSKAVSPLPAFGPSSETPMGAARLVHDRAEASIVDGSGSSLEVSRPFSVLESADRLIVPVPPGTPSLHDVSHVLEGFVPAHPRGLVSCH
jgi:hypothetical protein